jgi:PAS domain S-box-containing protein
MKSKKKHLAEAIKLLMSERSLTQAQLAFKTGLNPGQLSRILAGSNFPRPGNLQKIAAALGSSVDRLTGVEPPLGTRPSRNNERADKFRSAAANLEASGDTMAGNTGGSHTPTVLTRLSFLTDSLLSCFASNDEGNLNRLVSVLKKGFDAESVAIFYNFHASPDFLKLIATESDRQHVVPGNKSEVRIRSEHRGGLTGHTFHNWRNKTPAIENLGYESLQRNDYVAESYHEHLSTGKAYSILMVPLLNRKSELVGLLSLNNKKGATGKAAEEIMFSEEDAYLSKLLARKVVAVLESLWRTEAFYGIMHDLQEDADLDYLSNKILRRAVELLRADRGDFAVCENRNDGNDLVLRAVAGPLADERTLRPNTVLPTRSFMYSLWESDAGYRSSGDMKMEQNYYASNPQVKSELAVKFYLGRQPAGILNIESYKQDWFDDHDRETLQGFGSFAALALQVAGEELLLDRTLRKVLEPASGQSINNLTQTLSEILDAMQEIHGLDGGVIYLHDAANNELQPKAWIGCPELPSDAGGFTFKVDRQQSAALSVFESGKPFYSRNPESDSIVSKQGLKIFGIRGPLLGLPLVFSNRKVGVLMAWSSKGGEVHKGHLNKLGSLAMLAAWKIAMSQSNQFTQDQVDAIVANHGLIENIPGCAFYKDANGRFQATNKAFRSFLGKSEKEIRGKEDKHLFKGKLAEKYRMDDIQVMKTGIPILDYIETNALVDGKANIKVRVSKFPVRDAQKQIIGVFCFFCEVRGRS